MFRDVLGSTRAGRIASAFTRGFKGLWQLEGSMSSIHAPQNWPEVHPKP